MSEKMSFDQRLNKVNRISQRLPLATLCKSIAISGAVLFLLHTFAFNHTQRKIPNLFVPLEFRCPPLSSSSSSSSSSTDISHLVFVMVGSVKTWRHRRAYVEAWWRPNITKGHVFLEQPPTRNLLPWPETSPPFRVNKDSFTKHLSPYTKRTSQTVIRTHQSISESFESFSKDVRWFVIADDDTLFFLDNLVEVLKNYDHRKYYYIGMNSENIWSNNVFSFDMGYGGGGYVLSYTAVEALTANMEECIERYPGAYSDLLSFLCLSDLGVDLTMEKGIHQIDLHGDISGLLSAHPQSPLISLHHFEVIDPIFPSMSRQESVNHLMKTAKIDQSRLLQQTICYHRLNSWSISVSWGYSVHIYETIFPRNYLKRPLETFRPWKNVRLPLYNFNTRPMTKGPCEMPHQFFFDSIRKANNKNTMATSIYTVRKLQRLLPCKLNSNHSAHLVKQVRVSAPTLHKKVGRIECCDVELADDSETMDVKIRTCLQHEVLA